MDTREAAGDLGGFMKARLAAGAAVSGLWAGVAVGALLTQHSNRLSRLFVLCTGAVAAVSRLHRRRTASALNRDRHGGEHGSGGTAQHDAATDWPCRAVHGPPATTK